MLATRAMASHSWTPAALGGDLYQWFDMQYAAGVTQGDGTVSAVANRGVSGSGLTPGPSSPQPAYSATGLSGRPCMDFGASFQTMTQATGSSMPAGAYLFGLVISPTTSTGSVGRAFALTNGSADGTEPASFSVWGRSGTGGRARWNGTTMGPVSMSFGTPSIWAISVTAAGAAEVALNGTVAVTASSILVTAGTTKKLLIGITNPTSIPNSSENFYGQWGEALSAAGTGATVANRQRTEGYLAWHWGLQSLLPAGHPYKSAPP